MTKGLLRLHGAGGVHAFFSRSLGFSELASFEFFARIILIKQGILHPLGSPDYCNTKHKTLNPKPAGFRLLKVVQDYLNQQLLKLSTASPKPPKALSRTIL